MPSYGPGNQTLNISYTQNFTSSDVNKHYRDAISTGILWGGSITTTGSDTIDVAPFILLYQCTTGELIRVQSVSSVAVTTTETTAEYLVYNLSWANDATNYGTFSAKADDGNFNGNDIYANEIVFGKVVYGGGIITSVDLTNRSYPLYDVNKNLFIKNDSDMRGNVTIGEVLQCGTDIILPVDSAPSSPVKGSCYFDSATSKLWIYTGAAWIQTTLAP